MEWGFHLYFGETEFEIGFGEINDGTYPLNLFFYPKHQLMPAKYTHFVGSYSEKYKV